MTTRVTEGARRERHELGDSLLFPLFSLSKRLSPNPSVSNLSLRPGRYLSTVTRSSSRDSVDGQASHGKVCRDWRPLIRSRCKRRKITNEKQNYRVLPRRNLEAIRAVGANLRPLSFGGSVGPLCWSPQPW